MMQCQLITVNGEFLQLSSLKDAETPTARRAGSRSMSVQRVRARLQLLSLCFLLLSLAVLARLIRVARDISVGRFPQPLNSLSSPSSDSDPVSKRLPMPMPLLGAAATPLAAMAGFSSVACSILMRHGRCLCLRCL